MNPRPMYLCPSCRIWAKLMPTEAHKSSVQAVRRYAHVLGGTANVSHQGPGPSRRNGHRGIWGSDGRPDLYVQMPDARRGILKAPITYWHEVKVGDDRLRPAQRAFIERKTSAKGLPILVGGPAEMERFLGISRGMAKGLGDLRRQIRELVATGRLYNITPPWSGYRPSEGE